MQKLYRNLAIWRLKRRYAYLIEVDKVMEEFVTQTILDGGSQEFVGASRQQLLSLQNDIKSKQKLLAFLKSI
jgi:hypothetical protein